jgi:hypothetical protein
MEGILTHFNNPAGDSSSGSDRRGKEEGRSDTPPIDPDEEIDEDGAFNSEDELAYGDFFPPMMMSSSSSAGNTGVVATRTNDGNGGDSHAASSSSSSSSSRRYRPDGLPTSRSRSTSIAMIDEVVALQHPHQQYQGGGGGGGGGGCSGGGRNRIFSIDFDREFSSFLSIPPPPSLLRNSPLFS